MKKVAFICVHNSCRSQSPPEAQLRGGLLYLS